MAHQIIKSAEKTMNDGRYRLRRYKMRSLLTLIGALLLLAYYTYMCRVFLMQPPINQIAIETSVNAAWIYYLWFVLAVLSLDWARTGLANIEAAALMHPKLAPKTAQQLMWHADTKWANPLWWLRAIRAWAYTHACHCLPRSNLTPSPPPNRLWLLLSLTTFLIYVALPLSGLTLEMADVSVYSTNKAIIYGPNATTFNSRVSFSLSEQVYRYWASGRPTTPPNNTVLYAPEGTPNVSSTYLHDEAVKYADQIQVFAGPAVRQAVTGRTWGLSANISCRPIDPTQLQMMTILDAGTNKFHFQVSMCNSTADKPCTSLQQWDSYSDPQVRLPTYHFPAWYNDSRQTPAITNYNYIIAADGTSTSQEPPYLRDSNHDYFTFDSAFHERPVEDVTTSMIEFFLNEQMPELENNITARVAVRCDIASAVGRAYLNPQSLTYSTFERGRSLRNTADGASGAFLDMIPLQVLAAQTLTNGAYDYLSGEGGFDNTLRVIEKTVEPVWKALHTSINMERQIVAGRYGPVGVFALLTAEDVKLALYKLVGESIIAMMGEVGDPGWEGDLYTLQPGRYIVAGTVSWICVLVLLGCWASIMASGAVWVLVWAKPRWAASLDGFEMFKFGAQHADEVDDFKTVGFQGCGEVLNKVPGMVGVLPGRDISNPAGPRKLGFIGLSENVASPNVAYTLDRRTAALTRFDAASA